LSELLTTLWAIWCQFNLLDNFGNISFTVAHLIKLIDVTLSFSRGWLTFIYWNDRMFCIR